MWSEVNRINILLVDDDVDDHLFLNKALAAVSNSIKLSSAQDADTFFEKIEINQPSLVFLDFHLPKRNGLDLLKQIKNHPNYKHIPVVMWSTCNFLNNVVASYREGAQSYFVKPAGFKELVAGVKGILLQNGIEIQHAPDLIANYNWHEHPEMMPWA